MKRTLIQHVKVADPHSDLNGKVVDLLIDHTHGQVIDVGERLPATSDDIVHSLEGSYVSGGWVALALSLTEPGFELRDTLQNIARGASENGFTTGIFYPNANPPTDHASLLKAQPTPPFPINFRQVGALSEGLKGKDMTEFSELSQAGAVAFSDGFSAGVGSGLLLRVLDYARLFHRPIIQLPLEASIVGDGVANESPFITTLGLSGIPNLAETVFLARAIQIAEYTDGCRLHFSPITTCEGVEMIRQAKAKGLKITADTALPYLIFEDHVAAEFDTVYKVLPPIRTETDRQALIEGLKDSTLDCVSTHHQPLTIEEKLVEWDYAHFGMMTIQGFFPMLFQVLVKENGFSLERFIACISTEARKIFHLPASNVAAGATELTFFDPTQEWTLTRELLFSKSMNHPYLNRRLKGKVTATLSNGTLKTNPARPIL